MSSSTNDVASKNTPQLRRKQSLFGKLNFALITSSIIILLLTFTSFVIYDNFTHKRDYIEQIVAVTSATASNSQSAILTNDTTTANALLTSLEYYPNIRYAQLSNTKNNIIASYKNNWDQDVDIVNHELPIQIKNHIVTIAQSISIDDKHIGTLYLIADTNNLKEHQFEFIYLGGALLFIAIFINMFISSNIVISVKKPVQDLVKFSHLITQKKNYKQRAPQSPIFEIDTLVSSINTMLIDISETQIALDLSQERLSFALEGAGEGLWDFDLFNQKLFLDVHSTKLLEIDSDDDEVLLSTRQWLEKIHPDDKERFSEYTHQFIAKKQKHFSIELRVNAKYEWMWIKLTGDISQWNNNGIPQRMTGTLLDISKQRATLAQVQLYASVFDNTSDAIVILDDVYNVMAVNKAFTDITLFTANEIIGQPLPILNRLNLFSDIKKQLSETGHWEGELSDHRKDGYQFVLELALNTVKPNDETSFSYIVAVFSDITQRKQTQDELYFMANYDPLTKLANRAMFNQSFIHAINQAQRNDQTLAVLFIDLDKFKLVNDTLGHDAGDELLVQSSQRFKNHVRETDIVSRLSGDEFTIILNNITDVSQIQTIATNIKNDFQRSFSLKDQHAQIGTSIGISIYPTDGKDADTLIKNADTAMYYAKTNGRNNFHFFNSSMNKLAERRNLVEVELREAIKRNQIEILYQPKMMTKTEMIWGFEALVRWRHPTMGLISPDEFIPVAEEVGIIKDLGQYILTGAAKQLSHWHALGYTELHMAVNVSAREFQLSDYPIELAKLIAPIDIDPKFMELELTENIVMDDPEKMALMLDVIKNLGFSLSIDDFGTGYSSLSYLQRLPVDVLKVDQSFVRDIEHNPNSKAIARAIISMAHSLNLKVVAEGIETEAQLAFFKETNCELIQGYYFSKPLNKTDARQFLYKYSTLHIDSDTVEI